jgi:hypothetical protein
MRFNRTLAQSDPFCFSFSFADSVLDWRTFCVDRSCWDIRRKRLSLVTSLANLDKGISGPRRVHRFFKEGKEIQQLLVALQKPSQSALWIAETVRLAALVSFTLHDHATWLYTAQVLTDGGTGRAERIKYRGSVLFLCRQL